MVIASSQRLADTLGQTRTVTLIRNGADTAFFGSTSGACHFGRQSRSSATSGPSRSGSRSTGSSTRRARIRSGTSSSSALWTGADFTGVRRLGNVKLLGERPYAELPAYLQQFDAAIIPFKMTELTQSTNPVKLYEYLSAGVPVVASPMPELVAVGDLVYLATGRRASSSRSNGRWARTMRTDVPRDGSGPPPTTGARAVRRSVAPSHGASRRSASSCSATTTGRIQRPAWRAS